MRRLVVGLVLSWALSSGVQIADAQPAEGGFRAHTDVAVRGIPEGVNAITDLGYRLPLFDSENMVLRGTYLDGGVTTGLSPAYLWAGGYVEALPVAVLQLRAAIQYVQFFGTFGHLFQPRADGEWDLEALDADGDIDQGKVTHGLMYEGRATPRVKLGNFVAFAEVRFVRFEIEDIEGPWYEPYYDILLEPEDNMLIARPTAGYLLLAEDPKRTYLLLGARWERTLTQGTDLTRDLVAALALWKIPTDWWSTGAPRLAVLAGGWAQHPNDRVLPYVAAQLSMTFGAQ